MDSLFDQGGDQPVGDESRPDTGTEQPEVTPKPVSPLTEDEWLSCSRENPSLLRRLEAKAAYHFPDKMRQKRMDAVQESLDKLQDLAIEKKASSPAAKFDPIKQTRHVFGRVMRDWKTEKRGGKARILSLTDLNESGETHPKAKAIVQEHHEVEAYKTALKQLRAEDQIIVSEWFKSGTSLTHQNLAEICGCSRKKVASVLDDFERRFVEAMDDNPIC
jgi:hypothetical protein